MPVRSNDLTSLLARWKSGDIQALSEIAASAYGDLHAMASRHLMRERASHTLQATGLVNELYLRLRQMSEVQLVE
ncbi:MAG: RNA polymerase subunit sigma-70, partial [Acidobacteria bacterium]|nr:RNA polymerase subunit sigma-70 [Acidobacteriota bacterium]